MLSTAATPTRPPAITRVRPNAADELVGGAGAEHQPERERQHRRAGLQRAVAVRELQELREGEDRAHHREEDEPDAERGDREAGSAKNFSGSIGEATRRSQTMNSAPSAAAAPKPESTSGSDQPRGVASMIA